MMSENMASLSVSLPDYRSSTYALTNNFKSVNSYTREVQDDCEDNKTLGPCIFPTTEVQNTP